MILLDLGNTRLKLAALRDGDIADVSAIAHRDKPAELDRIRFQVDGMMRLRPLFAR